MKKEKIALRFSGIFFLMIAIMHLCGIIFKAHLESLGFREPVWYSVLVFIFSLLCALWILRYWQSPS